MTNMWIIKALEIKASLLFNLRILYGLILFNSCLLSYWTNVYPTAEYVIPIGRPTREAKAEIETHPVTVETEINK